MALDHKSLSLIIPAYNEEAYIGPCLDSVLQNAMGRFHEIIVVNNASTDRTYEVARARRDVRVVHTPDREVLKKRLGRFLLYRCGYATAGKLGLDRGAHISESSEPGVSEWTIPILRWPRSKTMGS